MASRFRVVLLFLLGFILFHGFTIAEYEGEIVRPIRTAPHRNLGSRVIDGSGKEVGLNGATGVFQEMDERMAGRSRVSVLTVAWLTLAMAVATGLGAVPFFFVELEPQWAGVCNGLAAGVMLAASFDLVQEGQMYGSGIWVVFGILSGGIFILLCKKVQGLVSITFFSFCLLMISYYFAFPKIIEISWACIIVILLVYCVLPFDLYWDIFTCSASFFCLITFYSQVSAVYT